MDSRYYVKFSSIFSGVSTTTRRLPPHDRVSVPKPRVFVTGMSLLVPLWSVRPGRPSGVSVKRHVGSLRAWCPGASPIGGTLLQGWSTYSPNRCPGTGALDSSHCIRCDLVFVRPGGAPYRGKERGQYSCSTTDWTEDPIFTVHL